MNSVGIDVSKGKCMVAALRPMGEVAMRPTEYLHTEVELERLAYAILALGEDTRVVMEATGRYHEPVAAALHEYGIYVSVLNPILIHQSGGGSVRKVKSDIFTDFMVAIISGTKPLPFSTTLSRVTGVYRLPHEAFRICRLSLSTFIVSVIL